MNPWLLVLVAGCFEVVWAVGMKYTDGFTRPLPTAGTLLAMGVSVWLLSRAVEHLPLGTAYAAWVGIGAVGTALVGMLFLGEPVTVRRLAWLTLLLVAVVGLETSTPPDPTPEP